MVNRAIKDENELPDDDSDVQEEQVQLNPLVVRLEEADEKQLAAIVREDIDNSVDARSNKDWADADNSEGLDFEEKYQELIDLYEGKEKTRKEKWMCRRSMKIAQAIVEMMVARLIPMVWNPNALTWKPVEKTDKKLAREVSEMMKWVVLAWMKMDRGIEDIVRSTSMLGTTFVETYWEVNKRDMNLTQEFMLVDENDEPVMGEDGQPMSVEEKMFRVDEKPAFKVIPITKLLIQPGAKDIQKEPLVKLEDFYFYELEAQEKEGLAYNVSDKLGTKIDERLEDKMEQALGSAENFAFQAKKRAQSIETATWWGRYDIDDDGFDEEVTVLMDTKDDTILRIFKTASVSRFGDRPIVKFDFLRRIYDAMYSIGLLEQVKPLAEEIDACFWQMQDANTLGIMRWGFYDPNSDYDPTVHVAKPRAMYPVSNPTQNVYFPTMDVPVERLLNAIKLILEFVERLTAASSYMMGKESNIVGGSGTATRTAAIQNSANIRFNLPASNIQRGIADLLRNIFNLCAMNAPEGLEKRIMGEDGVEIFSRPEVFEQAMALELDVYLHPDPTFGDVDTQRELAMVLYDKFVMGQNPLVVQNPNAVYFATEQVLRSFGQHPEDWLGSARKRKETNDPVEENTMMREGMPISAEPQENHLEHLMVHTRVIDGTDVLLWSKEGVTLLKQHIEEHKQMMQQLMIAGQQPQGGQSGQPGAVGANGGAASPTGSQFGLQSSASPIAATISNQAQGAQGGGTQL